MVVSTSLAVVRLDRDLPLPARAHDGDAGVDLYSAVDVELLHVERLQVIRLFSQPNELDRQPQLLLNRHHHPSLAGAVELGDDQPRQRHRFVEFARLVQRIHAGRRVQYQLHLVRRARHFLGQGIADFLQFLHQRRLGVHAAGCIEQ